MIAQQQAPVILKLADLDTMTVKAQVSEADVIRVRAGQTAYFTILGEPDKRHYGKLRAIEPAPQNYAEAQSARRRYRRRHEAEFGRVLQRAVRSAEPRASVAHLDDRASQHRARQCTQRAQHSGSRARRKRKDGTTVRVLRADGSTETRNVRIGINNNVRVEVHRPEGRRTRRDRRSGR